MVQIERCQFLLFSCSSRGISGASTWPTMERGAGSVQKAIFWSSPSSGRWQEPSSGFLFWYKKKHPGVLDFPWKYHSLLKIGRAPKENSCSNHPFSGANCEFFFGGDLPDKLRILMFLFFVDLCSSTSKKHSPGFFPSPCHAHLPGRLPSTVIPTT